MTLTWKKEVIYAPLIVYILTLFKNVLLTDYTASKKQSVDKINSGVSTCLPFSINPCNRLGPCTDPCQSRRVLSLIRHRQVRRCPRRDPQNGTQSAVGSPWQPLIREVQILQRCPMFVNNWALSCTQHTPKWLAHASLCRLCFFVFFFTFLCSDGDAGNLGKAIVCRTMVSLKRLISILVTFPGQKRIPAIKKRPFMGPQVSSSIGGIKCFRTIHVKRRQTSLLTSSASPSVIRAPDGTHAHKLSAQSTRGTVQQHQTATSFSSYALSLLSSEQRWTKCTT